jgi:hypothetical protein
MVRGLDWIICVDIVVEIMVKGEKDVCRQH